MVPSSRPGPPPESAGLPVRPTAIAGYPIAGPRGGIPDPGGVPGRELVTDTVRFSWLGPFRAGPAHGAAGYAHRTADRGFFPRAGGGAAASSDEDNAEVL